MADIINDTPRFLTALLGIESLSTFAFFISACTVASTANAGFNVMITAFLYIGFCLGGMYTLTRSQSGVAIGFLIGVSLMLTVLSLQTAVFWGQLANCADSVGVGGVDAIQLDISSGVIDHYTCANRGGMRSVCVFASINFIIGLAFSGSLIKGKDEIINEVGGYDDVGPGAGPYSIPPANGSIGYNDATNQPSTADL